MDESVTAFRVNEKDNVATLLQPVKSGQTVQIKGSRSPSRIVAIDNADAMHKIALRRIEAGDPILKYGTPIGHAVGTIEPGAWVHLHNLASDYDERSASLDRATGAPTDTYYQ